MGGKDKIKVNARIMAATNKDLKAMVKDGRFWRGFVLSAEYCIHILPPLRSRRQDIPQLIDYLLTKINLDLHKKIIGISDEVMDIFMQIQLAGQCPRTGESAGARLVSS